MSEGNGAIALTAAEAVEGKAVSRWLKTGPFCEGNAVRQLFGSGTLDGGVARLEACMHGPYDDPNAAGNAPAASDIVPLADVVLDDLTERAEQIFATRAHWLRVAVTGSGGALDTTWWLL
ncbi:MAG: hypothetical protein WCY11_10425 [Novosphingobium sp.]